MPAQTNLPKPKMSAAAKRAWDRRVRDENIRESEKRQPAKAAAVDERTPEQKKAVATEIRKRLRKVGKKESIPKKNLPYFVLRPMKEIPYERDFELVDHLHASYHKERDIEKKDRGDFKRTTLKIGHVNACPREVYYDFFQAHDMAPYKIKSLCFFEDGKAKHKVIQRRLEDMNVILESEGYLTIPGIPSNGFYDGLVPVGTRDGWKVCDILEIKTKMSNMVNEPSQRDYDQGQAYLIGAAHSDMLKMRRIKIRNLQLFYVDRSIQSDDIHYGYMCPPHAKRQADIMRYFKFLWEEVVGKKLLVPHPYEMDSSRCQNWCRYAHVCWKKFRRLDPPVDLDEIELPSAEIIQSHAARAYEIIQERAVLSTEYKPIKALLEAYFLKTQETFLKVKESPVEEFGIKPSRARETVWAEKLKLIEEIGIEAYIEISEPKSDMIKNLEREHYIDMGLIEKHRTYKHKSLSIKAGTRRKHG